MYGAVDIGGTKTLVAVFTKDGKITEQQKFPTSQNYEDFKIELAKVVANLSTDDFLRVGCGAPGPLDRKNGVLISCGNLGWKNEPLQRDLEDIFNCPANIENDAKVAAFSEAVALKDRYERVLYLTFSTGIGVGLVDKGKIDTDIGDRGGRAIVLEHEGKLQAWEDFASGKAIVAKYGKRASEINDQATWKQIVRLFALGILDLVAVLEPEVIVIGGGVGSHFDKFGKLLIDYLKQFETPMTKIPPIVQAKHPEEAVIYGCYEYAKHHHTKVHA